jgi:hypothetical protein
MISALFIVTSAYGYIVREQRSTTLVVDNLCEENGVLFVYATALCSFVELDNSRSNVF